MFATRTPAVLGRRLCAGLAAGSALLHGLLVGHVGSVAAAAFVLVMAGACLFCARELWLHGSLRAWCLVAVMNLGMIAAHTSLPGHHHGIALPGRLSAAPQATLMTVAIALSAAEVCVAAAVLCYRTRDRARTALSAPSREAW
jgi:hypothetical protein